MNPSFTQDELIQANSISPKSLSFPLNLIHVGGINEKKGSGQVLKIVELLKNRGIDVELHMLGDGEDRLRYENWVKEHGLESHVVFHGWLPKSELAPYYRKAHFLVFPSYSEGWPKVLSEGMAFGVVPIAGSVSCIPQVLGETKAGLAFHPDDVNAFVNAIEDYTTHPEMWAAASQAGVATSTQFTYNHFLEEIKRIFKTAWGIPLTESDQR
jgi:glycosyltransferase involved in cell wall biosynthesis